MENCPNYKYFFYCFSLILLCLIDFNNANKLKLRGVTIPNWPYAQRYEDHKTGKFKYSGYVIDLIDMISEIAGFQYDLDYPHDMEYGKVDEQGKVKGIIGEVYYDKADFAIADLTVTDERQRYVDFTEPFMKLGIAALVHKSNIGNIEKFSDLIGQAEVKYGTIINAHTYRYFSESRNPIARKMITHMSQNSEVFVLSAREGVVKVNTTKYAFISDSALIELKASIYCDLHAIYDTTHEFNDFTRNYAIALRRGSKYLNVFNKAINQLQINGQLDQLKNKYWASQCENDPDVNSSYSIYYRSYENFVFIFVFTLSIMFYSAFI